ncbi:50S ribosomal protein L31 [Candidatus Dojkabacteria bacterium]|uniref:Large ribosomal subunit protein bL31 n=1 Tax=Candidatus Dojkabacteria bacterium TaxID=2099670 RepID=A0A955RI53_9BACT|nr:50S ribosomal protein L31 [Candidatus Dojkabacteria bacterium]
MKKGIHPKYNKSATVTCACGSTFTTGSVLDEIQVEVCSQCHPFFTGKQRIVDTQNLVKKFEDRQGVAKASTKVSKKEKSLKRRERRQSKVVSQAGETTLKDMLKGIG